MPLNRLLLQFAPDYRRCRVQRHGFGLAPVFDHGYVPAQPGFKWFRYLSNFQFFDRGFKLGVELPIENITQIAATMAGCLVERE